MKRILPLLMLAGCSPVAGTGGAGSGGGGIVSTNPCADAMLVRMVAPGRIAAISRYSQDAGATSIPLDVARRFRTTAGTAEEVIALRPDLVLASSFTQPATRDAFARAGLRTVYLDSPVTVAASKAQVMQVAEAVGAPARGWAINAAIDRAVCGASGCGDALAPTAPFPRAGGDPEPGSTTLCGASGTGPPPARGNGAVIARGSACKQTPTALLYIAGDLANGGGTLLDALMTRAGLVNAAARYGLAYTGTLPAELLVARPPDVVIAPSGTSRGAALRRAMLPGTRFAAFDRRLVNCGGPTIVPAMARLRAIRAGVS